MPKHTYTVKVGEDTYDVSSERELTDAQAYQYALSQAGPAPVADTPGSKGGLVLAGVKAAAPKATELAADFATSPKVAATAAKIGRVIGGAAPIVGGAATAGPAGAAIGMAGAAHGAWTGGKTGWFTGKLAQNMAAPIASAMDSAAPYIQTLGTMSGIQSGLDLAQMAEPDRQDIGFLGIGGSATPDPAVGQRHRDKAIAEEQSKQEAWNRTKVMVADLMKQGLSKVQALEALLAVKSGVR